MKYLLIVLCLVLAGCATHKHAQAKVTKSFQAAMQKVLDERDDIRQIISHPPRTQAELDGPAQGNPNALLFNVQDFAQRLQSVPLTDCPGDFKTDFTNYVAAWQARAAQDPARQLLTDSGSGSTTGKLAQGASETEAAWQAVLAVQAEYADKTPPQGFLKLLGIGLIPSSSPSGGWPGNHSVSSLSASFSPPYFYLLTNLNNSS